MHCNRFIGETLVRM